MHGLTSRQYQVVICFRLKHQFYRKHQYYQYYDISGVTSIGDEALNGVRKAYKRNDTSRVTSIRDYAFMTAAVLRA